VYVGASPVAVKLTVIVPPVWHVHGGGASLVVQLIWPLARLQRPDSLLVIAVIVIPAGGAQKNVSMKPIPLVFATSSWYFPGLSHRIVVAVAASGEAAGVEVAFVAIEAIGADAFAASGSAGGTIAIARRASRSFIGLA
jgi:hypothetical protein